jgi:hypothetical protein
MEVVSSELLTFPINTYTAMKVISSLLITSPIKWMQSLPSSICFLQQANLIGQSLRKKWSNEFLPFGSTACVKGVVHVPKQMGYKWGAMENMLGEYIENLGNKLKTWW